MTNGRNVTYRCGYQTTLISIIVDKNCNIRSCLVFPYTHQVYWLCIRTRNMPFFPTVYCHPSFGFCNNNRARLTWTNSHCASVSVNVFLKKFLRLRNNERIPTICCSRGHGTVLNRYLNTCSNIMSVRLVSFDSIRIHRSTSRDT